MTADALTADALTVVAADAHRSHDPPYELNMGEVVRPVWERTARAEAIRAALAGAGHPVAPPTLHGLAPILAVHDPALVEFLETGWAAWRAAGGPPTLIPDTFVLPRLALGRARATRSPLGAPGAFCFDTATPMVHGTWAAVVAAADLALSAADLVAAGARSAYALCRPPPRFRRYGRVRLPA